jgi:peptidoglycan/xylan/chitin deacetylase (PgdA/CDA1 family)
MVGFQSVRALAVLSRGSLEHLLMISPRAAQQLVSGLFSRVPPTLFGQITRARLMIPYYHVVSDEDLWHIKHLYGYKTVRQFTEDLEYLLKYYSPIGLQDLLDHVKLGRPLPAAALLLTFDDGFREMYDVVAPILIAKGVNAVFFVNTEFIDNGTLCYLNKASLVIEHVRQRRSDALNTTLSRLLASHRIPGDDVEAKIKAITYQERAVLDQVVAAADLDVAGYLYSRQPYLTSDAIRGLIDRGFDIGAHSVDHPLYRSLTLDDQITQTVSSVTTIRTRFGVPYGAFAFPHSDRGVSSEYFRRIAATGLVDLSFGTAGLLGDSVPWNLQRFSLEMPLEPAPRVLAYHHVRRLGKLVARHGTVERE